MSYFAIVVSAVSLSFLISTNAALSSQQAYSDYASYSQGISSGIKAGVSRHQPGRDFYERGREDGFASAVKRAKNLVAKDLSLDSKAAEEARKAALLDRAMSFCNNRTDRRLLSPGKATPPILSISPSYWEMIRRPQEMEDRLEWILTIEKQFKQQTRDFLFALSNASEIPSLRKILSLQGQGMPRVNIPWGMQIRINADLQADAFRLALHYTKLSLEYQLYQRGWSAGMKDPKRGLEAQVIAETKKRYENAYKSAWAFAMMRITQSHWIEYKDLKLVINQDALENGQLVFDLIGDLSNLGEAKAQNFIVIEETRTEKIVQPIKVQIRPRTLEKRFRFASVIELKGRPIAEGEKAPAHIVKGRIDGIEVNIPLFLDFADLVACYKKNPTRKLQQAIIRNLMHEWYRHSGAFAERIYLEHNERYCKLKVLLQLISPQDSDHAELWEYVNSLFQKRLGDCFFGTRRKDARDLISLRANL